MGYQSGFAGSQCDSKRHGTTLAIATKVDTKPRSWTAAWTAGQAPVVARAAGAPPSLPPARTSLRLAMGLPGHKEQPAELEESEKEERAAGLQSPGQRPGLVSSGVQTICTRLHCDELGHQEVRQRSWAGSSNCLQTFLDGLQSNSQPTGLPHPPPPDPVFPELSNLTKSMQRYALRLRNPLAQSGAVIRDFTSAAVWSGMAFRIRRRLLAQFRQVE